MNHYIFNVAMLGDAERGLTSGIWEIEGDERHADALAPGDVALIYLAAPARVFIGRAEIASSVRAEAARCDVVFRSVER
ncbi:MAG TPA: hypothetical protein VJZ00_17145 [Thermoanaerobaculia bacterium]|nr:hypothetical protein [Thermoanaerobaculia bacterium]